MRILHYISWLSFIGVFLYDLWQHIDIQILQNIHVNLISMEFASREEGRGLLYDWSLIPTRSGVTVLGIANLNTRWDFLFILGYVSVLIIVSYNQMQREPRAWLNTLLRLNFLLAILTGLLDVIENCILLNDMAPYNIGNTFYPSHPISIAKFLIGGWAVLVWLLSLATSWRYTSIRS